MENFVSGLLCFSAVWLFLVFFFFCVRECVPQNPAEHSVAVQRIALRALQGAIHHLKQVVRLSSKLKCFDLNELGFN